MDAQFLKRVYRTSVYVWTLVTLGAWGVGGWRAGVGVTVGFVLSLGSLILLERLVQAVFTPEHTAQSKRAVRRLLLMAALKYGVIGLTLWAALKSGWANPIGLAIGIGLPEAVIFLKAIGTAITFGPELDRR